MSYNEYAEPLAGIDCDRIVESNAIFQIFLSFFVIAAYLPSSNHDDEDFSEHPDLLWSLYNFLSPFHFILFTHGTLSNT